MLPDNQLNRDFLVNMEWLGHMDRNRDRSMYRHSHRYFNRYRDLNRNSHPDLFVNLDRNRAFNVHRIRSIDGHRVGLVDGYLHRHFDRHRDSTFNCNGVRLRYWYPDFLLDGDTADDR